MITRCGQRDDKERTQRMTRSEKGFNESRLNRMESRDSTGERLKGIT